MQKSKETSSVLNSFMLPDLGLKTTALLFILVFAFSFCLRSATFRLPHSSSDQLYNISTAFKLDREGLKGYNLYGIDVYSTSLSKNLRFLEKSRDQGAVLKSLEKKNITFYHRPLHYSPYGFPAAIMLSHRTFSPKDPYYMVTIPNPVEVLRQYGPEKGLRDYKFPENVREKQLYSIIIPFFFSLISVMLVFFIALSAYNKNLLALAAMFLYAISPIDLLSSQKLWAEDMMTALLLCGVLSYFWSVKKDKIILAFLSGVFCGLSSITKQSGAFILPAFVLWHFISNSKELFKKETFIRILFDKKLIFLAAGFLLASGHWFYIVYKTYGNPFSLPIDLLSNAKTGWYQAIVTRPWYLYLVGIPYQNPLFSLAYFSPLILLIDKKNRKTTLFLILWIIAFFLMFQIYLGWAKEHRYMLPIYPALAILAAYCLDKARYFIDKKLGFFLGTLLFVCLLSASAIWSVPMGLNAAWTKQAELMIPF